MRHGPRSILFMLTEILLGYVLLERAVGKYDKLGSLKLQSFCFSWKETSEIGKFLPNLGSFAEVGNYFRMKLFPALLFSYQLNFPTSLVLSKLIEKF